MDTATAISTIPAAWATSFVLGLLFRMVIFFFKFLDKKIERG